VRLTTLLRKDGYVLMPNRALISVLIDHRRSTVLHRNGVPARLKKLIVSKHCLLWFGRRGPSHLLYICV